MLTSFALLADAVDERPRTGGVAPDGLRLWVGRESRRKFPRGNFLTLRVFGNSGRGVVSLADEFAEVLATEE